MSDTSKKSSTTKKSSTAKKGSTSKKKLETLEEKKELKEVEEIIEIKEDVYIDTSRYYNLPSQEELERVVTSKYSNLSSQKEKLRSLLQPFADANNHISISGYCEAMFKLCYEYNIFYDEELLTRLLPEVDETAGERLPESYLFVINENEKYKGLSFLSQLDRTKFVKMSSEEIFVLNLKEEDQINRQKIFSIVGYDPFKDNFPEERPQLYAALSGILTEAMRNDIPRQKSAIQIVRSYANIDKYQKIVDTLMTSGRLDEDTQKQIINCNAIIAKIQASINQTTKENSFSGGRMIGQGGRGILSDVMNQVQSKNYDKGITNFYDISTSASIKQIADISAQSILNQLSLTAADYGDMLAEQTKLVREAREIAKKTLEMYRVAKSKIVKEKLLEELAEEYRLKGLSEEDIEDFLSKEYILYEPESRRSNYD